jgi:hypothetical protein
LQLPAHDAGNCKLVAPMTVLSLYARIWRTYVAWARPLLLVALVVFVPLGLIHTVPVNVEATGLTPGSGLKITAAALAVMLLTTTGLLGEVFYTGAVAIALTHPHDGTPPSLREIAGMVKYGRLIAIDLIFGILVAVGMIAVVPGVLLFVYLGLAAPVVEIEHGGVRSAFARSYRLVRGHFWHVAAVLVPIEIATDATTDLATSLAHSLLGNSILAEWLVDTSTNVLLTPFYAVAAILLTLELVADRDGTGPRLHSAPASR